MKEFIEESDIIQQFIDCKLNVKVNNALSAKELYESYCNWCEEFDVIKESPSGFGTLIKTKMTRKHTNKGNFYIGYNFKSEHES